MSPSVSHLAGPAITVDGRLIQRCCICGEKLIDTQRQMSPTNPDGSTPQPSKWAEGHFVQVEGNRSLDTGDHPRLPKDSCIDLVEL